MHTPHFAAAMARRQLLKSLAIGGLASVAGSGFAADASSGAFARSFAPLDGALHAGPGEGGQWAVADIAITGRLPEALRGTLYRNGPARFALGSTRYQHWFDGDGMVQAFRLQGGKASYRGQLLRTPKLLEEEAAGRFLYPAFGTPMADAAPVRSADAVNPANINLLPMQGGKSLYALWEAGSALQIDPDTLAAQGFKAWSPETQGAPFSAHPRIAPDGTVWNFGYSAHSGKLIIYEIAPGGQLRRQTLLDAPQADMVHDFAITENHLVFLLMPLLAKPGAPPVGSLDRYEWQAQAPMLVMLVSKADFSVRRMELPNGGVFHIGNAWEDKGLIRLGYARYTEFLPHLKGLGLPSPTARLDQLARWTQVEINLAQGTARQFDVGLAGVEFPRFDARLTGQRSEFGVLMQNSGSAGNDQWGMDSVVTHSGTTTARFRYGSDWIAEEHLYVPAPGSSASASGWVLGTALQKASGRTTLSVFEADAIASGPVAQLALPFGLPLGLHGQFVTA